MTFQQLQYLLQVSQSGSISKAAKSLFVSQPSVSVAISALEEELGFPIFSRTQRGLAPTPEGMLVLEYAQRICATHALLTGINEKTSPTMQISCDGYLPAHRAFSRLLEECRDRTDITFRFSPDQLKATMDKLAGCELDVGFLFVLSSWEQVIRSQLEELALSCEVLESIPAAIRISPRHPLYHKENLTPADFAQERLLEGSNREISSSLLKGIIPIDQKRIVVCEQPTLLNRLVEDGIGYTVGYQLVYQKTSLRYVPLGDLMYRVLCVTNPIRPRTPELQRYIDLVKEEIVRQQLR